MPLKRASNPKSKKSVNKAVSANIAELKSSGTKKRSQKQIIAIAESAARRKKKK